jgi:hypothetical protein
LKIADSTIHDRRSANLQSEIFNLKIGLHA